MRSFRVKMASCLNITGDPDRRAIASGNGSYFNNTMLDNSPGGGAAAMTVGGR